VVKKMPIQRLYDFQPGTRISSQQMDDELTQLVNEVNDKYSKQESDTRFAQKQQENWINAVMLNGWVTDPGSNSPTRFYKDEFGIVHIAGPISGGTKEAWTQLFILPAGYRPSTNLYPICMSDDGVAGSTIALPIQIRFDGIVMIHGATSKTYISFNELSFRTY
jgi:hypothetical protein